MSDYLGYNRRKWIRLSLIIAACLIIAGSGYLIYRQINKPIEYTVSPGESIQKVLNEMPVGDTCYIKPGIYKEALTIPRSGLTLKKTGRGQVIIDGGGAENTILIDNVSDTTLQGLIIKNSKASLILITGLDAARNTVKQCNLLEWGLDETTPYAGAVDSSDGAAYTTVDSCYIDRGNHEASWISNPEAITYHFSGGHHTITNNVIWGVCRDSKGNPIELQPDFGDGYPLYKFNILDSMSGQDGPDRLDFDGTLISGNHLYGAHDDMIGIQGRDENCTISNNYIDSMGGSVSIVIRGASVGPIYITKNIMVNSGINGFKYASWDMGASTGLKYITDNIYYSSLSRSYCDTTETDGTFYVPQIDRSYSRFLDGEVNNAEYDNLHVENNYVYSKRYFLTLMPGSGTNNTFINNHFSTDDPESCVKWFSNNTAINFSSFNSYTGGTNVWEVIPRPSKPALPRTGAP